MSVKRVWKYNLAVSETTLSIPEGAGVLHVAEQGWELCLWALVDPEQPLTERRFVVVGAGRPFNSENTEHIGTVMSSNGLVWHVFECAAKRDEKGAT